MTDVKLNYLYYIAVLKNLQRCVLGRILKDIQW